MNPRDQYLQQLVPTVMVPRFEQLQPLETSGHRYLACAAGLKLEIRRPWLHAIVTVAANLGPELPYGAGPSDKVELTCGVIPRELLQAFVEHARAALPNEVQAWVVWNEAADEFELQILQALSASPGHINYNRPNLPLGTWQVMDIHSHGIAAAFFSEQDDRDDQGEIKLAAVVGSLLPGRYDLVARGVMLGNFVDLSEFSEVATCTS